MTSACMLPLSNSSRAHLSQHVSQLLGSVAHFRSDIGQQAAREKQASASKHVCASNRLIGLSLSLQTHLESIKTIAPDPFERVVQDGQNSTCFEAVHRCRRNASQG